LDFKAPKDHRPSKMEETTAKDRGFLLETLSSLSESLTNVLLLEDIVSKLTAAELLYFTIISSLASLAACALPCKRSDAAPPVFQSLAATVKATLQSLRGAVRSVPPSTLDHAAVFYTVADQHSLGMLRDSAQAAKHTAAFILALHEQDTARDKSGKSGLPKEIVADLKSLESQAAKILLEIRDAVKALKEELGEPGWLDRVAEWTFGPGGEPDDAVAKSVFDMAGGQAVVDDWTGRVLDGWREAVRGWGFMKFE
jgi:N-terminal acetyltransferase B complex non-catalytic subunit